MNVSINPRIVRDQPCWVVDWTRLDGKRQRRFFTSKRAAEAEAASAHNERRETGDVGFRSPPSNAATCSA